LYQELTSDVRIISVDVWTTSVYSISVSV